MDKGFINIKGKSIYYKFINKSLMINNNPLLIFLHHGLGSTEQWSDFPKLLSNAVQCPALLYDRIGYGKSDQTDRLMNKNFLHDEAEIYLPALIDQLQIRTKIILIGHSDGGSIALIYSSRRNDNLLATIAEAPHVLVENITRKGIEENIHKYKHSDMKKYLSIYHGNKTDITFKNWSNNWLSEDFRTWSILNLLHRIKKPLLVLQGDKDEFGTLTQIDIIKQETGKNCTQSVINNCGHFPHKQYKEEVVKQMRDFILQTMNYRL